MNRFVAFLLLVGLSLFVENSVIAQNPYPTETGIVVLDLTGAPVGFYRTGDVATDVDLMPEADQFCYTTANGELVVMNGDGSVVSEDVFFHLNDVDVINNGAQFLLTSREQAIVALVDRATKQQTVIPFNFIGPVDADLLPNGNLLVCDASGSRVVEITQDGQMVWSYNDNIAQPMDALRLPDGNTLISDFDHHRVIEVTPDGRIALEHRGFDHPFKISAAGNDKFLIADSDRQRLVELHRNGDQREIRGNLNFMISAVFLPDPGYYLCAVQNKFHAQQPAVPTQQPPQTTVQAIKEVKSYILLFQNRYTWLVLGIVLGLFARFYGEGRELTRIALVTSYLCITGVGYVAIVEAASREPYVPPMIFWYAAAALAGFAFRDARQSIYPMSKWINKDSDFRVPHSWFRLAAVVVWAAITMVCQILYFNHGFPWDHSFWRFVERLLPNNGDFAWYIPMGGWVFGLYLLFRPFIDDGDGSEPVRTEVQMGKLRLAVPFTTGSVSMDAEDETHDTETAKNDTPYYRSWANTIVLVTVLLGLGLYTISATSVPTDVHGDEGEVALHGINMRDSGDWNFFTLGWYQIPNFFFLLPAWVMWIFGDNLFGMRMTGALIGVASIPVFFMLARRLMYPIPAAMATFLFAVSSYFVHFSRMGTGYNQATLLMVAVLYFLVRGIQDSDAKSVCLAGFLSAVGFVSYQGAHILAPISMLTIGLLFLTRVLPFFKTVKTVLLFLLAFWVGFSPVIGTIARDPKALSSRASAVSIFTEEGREMISRDFHGTITTVGEMIPHQLQRTALGPISHLDASPYTINPRYGGMLDPLPALFFTAGLFTLLALGYHPTAWMMLVWLVMILIPGSALTNSAPAFQRLTGVFPILILIAAPCFYALFAQIQRGLQLSNTAREVVLGCLFTVILLFGIHRYFNQIQKVPQMLDEHTRVARFIQQAGSNVYFYHMGLHRLSINYGTVRFLAPDRRGRDVENPEEFLKHPVDQRGRVCFILMGNNRNYIGKIRQMYPGGREQNHFNIQGAVPFTTYEVDL